MEAKDTVKKAGELCLKVCLDHRSATLEAKDCTGLDCEECQLKEQAEISFKAGIIREVVEWIRYNHFTEISKYPTIKLNYDKWQAKLKEWGIE